MVYQNRSIVPRGRTDELGSQHAGFRKAPVLNQLTLMLTWVVTCHTGLRLPPPLSSGSAAAEVWAPQAVIYQCDLGMSAKSSAPMVERVFLRKKETV